MSKTSKSTAKTTSKRPVTSPDDKKLRDRMFAHYSGATVSQQQLNTVRKFVKRHCKTGILAYFECTAPQLKRYAESKLSLSELSDVTHERLNRASDESKSDVYSKPWQRKTAAMMYELALVEQREQRKTATPTETETSE